MLTCTISSFVAAFGFGLVCGASLVGGLALYMYAVSRKRPVKA